MENKLIVSSSPHLRSAMTTQKIMLYVILALLPACGVAVYVFGLRAVVLIAVSILAAVATEYLMQKLMHKKVTISDLSAVVTGLLLALNLPINAPVWLAVIGSFIAIALTKQLYGGLGHNFVNPALAARAILMISWPAHMAGSAYIPVDSTVSATPLVAIAQMTTDTVTSASSALEIPSTMDLFLGVNGIYGCIGEISALALILGGLFLIFKKVISPRIPVVYIATVAIFSFLVKADVTFVLDQLFAGGLMLGAIFMATDYVTSPSTPVGQLIYAVGCGVITCVIRFYGAYTEGVSFAILLMNVAAPLIEKYTKIKKYGAVKK